MATRNTKQAQPQLKATAKTAHERMMEDLRAQAAHFSDEYDACSPKRIIAAWVLGTIVAVGSAIAGAEVLGYLVVGAMMLTGSSFFAMLIYALGMVLAIYATVMAFSSTFQYVVSSKCTQHMELVANGASSLTNRVRGWCGYGSDVIVEAAR